MKGKKRQTITDKFRKNVWMASTFVLTIFCLILIINMTTSDIIEEQEVNREIPTLEEYFCPIIKATPSWGDIKGNIIHEGYIDFHTEANMSYDVVNEFLIPNKVIYIYRDTCSWCNKQKELFGNTWENYINSGLTVDCGMIINER